MIISILLYYFVAVCNPDTDLCDRYPIAGRWPGFVLTTGAYDVDGPFFSAEDCDTARVMKGVPKPYVETAEGGVEMNPWGTPGTSACFAREIHVTTPT